MAVTVDEAGKQSLAFDVDDASAFRNRYVAAFADGLDPIASITITVSSGGALPVPSIRVPPPMISVCHEVAGCAAMLMGNDEAAMSATNAMMLMKRPRSIIRGSPSCGCIICSRIDKLAAGSREARLVRLVSWSRHCKR